MDTVLHNINIYNQYVQEYITRFMDLDLYKDTFHYLLQTLPRNANVLELGCGPGNVVKYLKSQRTDLHFLGVDLAPEMIKTGKEQNPQEEFRLLDIREAHQINQQFSAVIAAFCIPYLSINDLPHFFLNLKNLTENGGLAYLSCMEGAHEKSGYEKTSFTGDSEMYITYYQRTELELLMNKHGFKIKQFYTKDYPETDGSVTTDLIYIAEK